MDVTATADSYHHIELTLAPNEAYGLVNAALEHFRVSTNLVMQAAMLGGISPESSASALQVLQTAEKLQEVSLRFDEINRAEALLTGASSLQASETWQGYLANRRQQVISQAVVEQTLVQHYFALMAESNLPFPHTLRVPVDQANLVLQGVVSAEALTLSMIQEPPIQEQKDTTEVEMTEDEILALVRADLDKMAQDSRRKDQIEEANKVRYRIAEIIMRYEIFYLADLQEENEKFEEKVELRNLQNNLKVVLNILKLHGVKIRETGGGRGNPVSYEILKYPVKSVSAEPDEIETAIPRINDLGEVGKEEALSRLLLIQAIVSPITLSFAGMSQPLTEELVPLAEKLMQLQQAQQRNLEIEITGNPFSEGLLEALKRIPNTRRDLNDFFRDARFDGLKGIELLRGESTRKLISSELINLILSSHINPRVTNAVGRLDVMAIRDNQIKSLTEEVVSSKALEALTIFFNEFGLTLRIRMANTKSVLPAATTAAEITGASPQIAGAFTEEKISLLIEQLDMLDKIIQNEKFRNTVREKINSIPSTSAVRREEYLAGHNNRLQMLEDFNNLYKYLAMEHFDLDLQVLQNAIALTGSMLFMYSIGYKFGNKAFEDKEGHRITLQNVVERYMLREKSEQEGLLRVLEKIFGPFLKRIRISMPPI